MVPPFIVQLVIIDSTCGYFASLFLVIGTGEAACEITCLLGCGHLYSMQALWEKNTPKQANKVQSY